MLIFTGRPRCRPRRACWRDSGCVPAMPLSRVVRTMPDRPRVGAAVGVAADPPVDRAGVQARPAADAVQASRSVPSDLRERPLSSRTRWNSSGPSSSPGRRGPRHRRVAEASAPSRPGQQLEEDRQVRQRGMTFRCPSGRRGARQRGQHAAVALVGDEDDGAGLGDGEVGAGDAHVGPVELLAQQLAGRVRASGRRAAARRARRR